MVTINFDHQKLSQFCREADAAGENGWDRFADDDNGISRKEGETLRSDLASAITDETRSSILIAFARNHGERGFQFIQSITGKDGSHLLPVSPLESPEER